MNNIINTTYFNEKNWLLDNFVDLKLKHVELIFFLLVINVKKYSIKADLKYYQDKLGITSDKFNLMIKSLEERKYLKIKFSSTKIDFDITNIFNIINQDESVNQDIFEQSQRILSKPLSQIELEKISNLINKFGEKKYKSALRDALANEKLSLAYIEKILINEKK